MEIAYLYSRRETRREIYRLAWPSIVEQLLIMLVGMVSTMFVGQIGKESLVAVGMVNMIIFFIQSVFAALSTGATVLVARLTGEGDLESVKDATLQSVVVGILSSILVTLICYFFSQPILTIFLGHAEPEVLRQAVLYYKITLISLPFMIINIVVGGAFRGAGDTRTPMYVSFVVNIVNIILGYVLIFGAGIINPMGIQGAAIAVTISRGVGGMAIVCMLYAGMAAIKLSVKDGFAPDITVIKRLLHVGLPASLEQGVMQGGFLMMQVLIVSMGTVSSAVYQIAMNANSLAFMPIFGFSLAATTLVGQNLGKKDLEAAEECSMQTLGICIVLISAIGLLLFVFSKELVSLYSNDPEVIALGSTVIKIFAVGEPMLAVMNVISSVLRGAGDIKYIMFTSIIGIWAFRIFLSYLLNRFFHLGVIGVWIAIISDFIIRSLLYWVRFKAGKWKYIKI